LSAFFKVETTCSSILFSLTISVDSRLSHGFTVYHDRFLISVFSCTVGFV
jgi:hypothetical protein